ncbi:MEIOTIC F-BOX protein MOF-like [Panicum hallii]|uniref:MEIOTIC F-BOX protein MOF-like n=1 Tax=Panicum hallii TaxID=206008 RepID=UPI000DF4D4F4|nr:MEIOTIC F-BOX protein MOF-like [Panicum hallii]
MQWQFYIRNLINPQLRTLSLNWCFHCKHDVNKFKALGKLLQKLPNLEKLTLKNFWVRPAVGPNEFPILENLRTLLLDECDLRDNIRLLLHFLQSSPNLEKLTVRLCKLPKIFPCGEGKAR